MLSLNALEGYYEDYPEDSLYIPVVCQTDVDSVLLYVWNREMEGLTEIPTGDWMNRSEVDYA